MAFNDDEKPPVSNAGSTRGIVTIKPVKYSKEDAALTADTVTAVVELNATPSTAVREGLDLVAVLDVSGGVTEEQMDNMKMAVRFVIMKLTPADRLSVVSFSDAATRHSPLRCMTPAAQADLRAAVDGLAVARGGARTNVMAGLEAALSVLDGRVHTGGRTANIFLVASGKENDGDARLVDPGNVAVYTFGVGMEADQQLLSDVAKKSLGGTFSSVPDGKNLRMPFSQLLGGLLTVVAQDVELTLTPSTDDGDFDTMSVDAGADCTQTTDGATGEITVKFGTLFSGEARRVVVNLTLLPTAETEAYDATLAVARHSYTVQGKVQLQAPQDIQITRTPKRAPAEAEDIAQENGQSMVGMLRGELQQLLGLMGSAQGRATETSHGRQRYAARDDDVDAVRLFSTPRMDTYLDQAKRFEKDATQALPTDDDDVKEEPQGRHCTPSAPTPTTSETANPAASARGARRLLRTR